MTVGGTVSLMNGDAQIAREWAEKVSVREKITFSVDDETLAVARYILATTTPPTMADVEWDDEEHSGLCATFLGGRGEETVVRMLTRNAVGIVCRSPKGFNFHADKAFLTPIPGTRLDLTPRREQEPESTPDHPAVLTIEADYRNAPVGTVVATEGEGAWTWTKGRDGLWEAFGIISGYNNYAVSDEARQVLRWGWEA